VKKVLLSGALLGVAALGATGPASASVKRSPVHWNVKCENIAKLHLRKGVDCAHTLKRGQHWDFPKGVRFQKDLTTSGNALSIKFQITAVGGKGSLYGIGPGGKYGQLLSGEAPYTVYATRPMIVVAATKKF
jgi:hypothetical protein